MSNKEETSKTQKSKELSKKINKDNAKMNSNKQKIQNQKIKENEGNIETKEKVELSSKNNEYLNVIENLKLKLKNIEQNTENEENKLKLKNAEKEKRLQVLNSSNQKITHTLDILKEKMAQVKANMEKNKNENTQIANNSKISDEINEKKETEISLQDQDIKSKQKLINILSNENKSLKKSIDYYYNLNETNKFYAEIRQKEKNKKDLEKEIKSFEKIISKHNTECVDRINQLEKELNQIKSKLNKQNKEYHNKNKDYFYLQSKFSLQKKEDEKYYNELKNRHNYLDMNKQSYLINIDLERMENMKSYINKRKELSYQIENGLINKYEKIIPLPKIDTNLEKKIISSIFTEEEIEKIKNLYENDEEKFNNFIDKVTELERGGITDVEGEELIGTCSDLEKEIKLNEENVFLEKHKLKNKDLEINQIKQDYRNKLKKNLKLKKEEKSLKDNLEKVKYQYNNMIYKQNTHKEINNIIDGINDIVGGSSKNKKKKNEDKNDNKEKKEEEKIKEVKPNEEYEVSGGEEMEGGVFKNGEQFEENMDN